MRRLVRATVFPLFVASALAVAWWALARGAGAEAVLGACFALCAVGVGLIERVLPYRAEWNANQGDLAADALYLPTTWAVQGVVQPLVAIAVLPLAAALSSAIGASGAALWPQGWPIGLQLVLACAIAELFDYAAHRAMHENACLWRFHATHHSARRLYWLNATRSHPVEMVFRGALGMAPLALLGTPEIVLALFGVITIAVGLWQHANVDFALGPLRFLASVGEMHRWHHSRDVGEANHNYGNNFLVWDVIFGTHYAPRDREPASEIGIAGLDAFPTGYGAQLLAPFRWRRIREASALLQGDRA
jgi:sterol desaturase/sphingolipid hydroxylase (fatty acid hydroxylase superfamily)